MTVIGGEDHCADVHERFAGFVLAVGNLFDLDGGSVGQFLRGHQEQFFADDFGDPKFVRDVANLTFGIIHRADRQVLEDGSDERGHILAGQRGEFDDIGVLRGALQPAFAERPARLVELIEHQNSRVRDMFDDGSDPLVFRANRARRVGDMDDHVNPLDGVTDFVVEIGDEATRLRLKNAWRIHKHNLAGRLRDDAVVGVARGLRLRGDDGNFGADERIEQRGLAGVGAADEYGETGFALRCVHACIVP